MVTRWRYLLVCFILLITSCDVFDIHPYSGDIKGSKNINQRNIKTIEELYADKDSIKYAFISDSQRWYDELEDAVEYINNSDEIDFVIHGGDIADFGLTKEFILQRDILEKLNKPYVVIIGNHDCLANGEEIFQLVFGDLNFSFIAGKTKFIGLNTNALESNYANPIPNFSFLNAELQKDKESYNQTVIAMHARPGTEQFNNNVANVFQYSIQQFKKPLFSMHGHEHNYAKRDLFEDNHYYYGVPNIGKRQFLVFSITPSEYHHELRSF